MTGRGKEIIAKKGGHMSKYKKVKKALNICADDDHCRDCRYRGKDDCIPNLMRDAVAVMEQLKKKGKKK